MCFYFYNICNKSDIKWVLYQKGKKTVDKVLYCDKKVK